MSSVEALAPIEPGLALRLDRLPLKLVTLVNNRCARAWDSSDVTYTPVWFKIGLPTLGLFGPSRLAGQVGRSGRRANAGPALDTASQRTSI